MLLFIFLIILLFFKLLNRLLLAVWLLIVLLLLELKMVLLLKVFWINWGVLLLIIEFGGNLLLGIKKNWVGILILFIILELLILILLFFKVIELEIVRGWFGCKFNVIVLKLFNKLIKYIWLLELRINWLLLIIKLIVFEIVCWLIIGGGGFVLFWLIRIVLIRLSWLFFMLIKFVNLIDWLICKFKIEVFSLFMRLIKKFWLLFVVRIKVLLFVIENIVFVIFVNVNFNWEIVIMFVILVISY